MTLFLTILFITLCILLAGTYSGLETGGYRINRIRLRHRSRHHDRAAGSLRRVLADAHLFIFTVLIGHNISVYLVSRSVTQLYLRGGLSEHAPALFGIIPWNAETAATLTLMLPLFLFAEIIPKNLFNRRADVLMYRLSGVLKFTWRILLPVTVPLNLLFNLLAGRRGRSDGLSGFSLSLQGLREYFTEETRRTALSDHQHGMIDNLVAMHRVPVCDVMQPLTGSISVPETAAVGEVLALMRAHSVELVTVHRGSTRRLTGFVTLFELIDPAVSSSGSIKPHIRKLIRISADLSLTRAFRRLRQAVGTPAVIVDRAARTVGILHLRDVARYLVSGS